MMRGVRRLLFRQGVLWAGDEMGSVCQWSANLSSCNLKQEYYTAIWSMLVSRDNNTVYTARDNEIIVDSEEKLLVSDGPLHTIYCDMWVSGQSTCSWGRLQKKKTWIFGDIVLKGGREVRLNHILKMFIKCDIHGREGVN